MVIKKHKGTPSRSSGRVKRELLNLNKINMNRNYNRRDRDGEGYEDVVAIVNEEFAKNATPEVTKAAILARLDDDCGEELSFPNQAAKDAAIKVDAANPVSAKHTAALASATVTG